MNDIAPFRPRLRGPLAPLAEPLFRRIWLASLCSNFGLLIQGVGAAWAMTEMTGRADMVALVQSAAMTPLMLGSIVAGAIADMYDRRRIVLAGVAICLSGATGLTLLGIADFLTPFVILMCSFVIGSGTAVFNPAWQASVREQVKPEDFPAAVAMTSISYNIARSFGPAIGGMLVAVAGVVSTFAFNAIAYLPLLAVIFLWRRKPVQSRLPPEGLGRAIISGLRFVFHSPPIRRVCLRTLIIALTGSSVFALMPFVARELLDGDAATFGLMLGAFGVGGVGGALCLPALRARLSNEGVIALSGVVISAGLIGVGLSRSPIVTGLLLVACGVAWMVSVTICNICVQVSAPRWVTGRALAAYQAALTGGIALGSWGWGHVAVEKGTGMALIISGVTVLLALAARFWAPVAPSDDDADNETPLPADPETRLNLSGRSGPIVVSIEYRVATDQARQFYGVMQQVQSIRQRTGAYGWSIARDIADPEMWTERYHTPTWHDFLRQRSRVTERDHRIITQANEFDGRPGGLRVRRSLERPFGSVRWTEDSPDRAPEEISELPPMGGI